MLRTKSKIWLLLLSCCSSYLLAADVPVAPKLSDAAWLAGIWKSASGERMSFEEHWTAPAAGNMMGMFRLLAGEKVVVYEYLLIEQESDGTYMRLRHYQPKMVDVDKAPIRCRLAEATSQKLVFENPDSDKPKRITYSLDDGKQLSVAVETTREGKPTTFTLRFQRAEK